MDSSLNYKMPEPFTEDIREIAIDCCGDTGEFGKTFTPHLVSRPFDPPDLEMLKILDDESIKRAVVAAPRATGKTTKVSLIFPIRKICYQEAKFIILVSATNKLAQVIVSKIARELTENPRIIKIFGDLKGSKWAEGEGHIRTSTGITLLARGSGQQIRGLLEDGRPDLILLDDLEDPEPFRLGDATEYIRKTWEWLRTDLENVVDLSNECARFLCCGTVLGENSVLVKLLEDPSWRPLRQELCDDNYVSNYPSYLNDKQVQALAKRYEHDLDFFYREFRNLPIAGETASFRKEFFKYWTDDIVKENEPMQKAVIVDPAKTTNMQSAESAIVGVGFNAVKNNIFQLDTENKRVSPDELYYLAWSMAMRLKCRQIAVEVTSLEDYIVYPFNNFLKTKGFPEIISLKAAGKKQDRIKELSGPYRMGNIWHHPNPLIHGPLESQLIAFPRSRLWDVMDAMAYCLKLFKIHDLYFSVPNYDSNDFDQMIAELDKSDGYEPISRFTNFRESVFMM